MQIILSEGFDDGVHVSGSVVSSGVFFMLLDFVDCPMLVFFVGHVPMVNQTNNTITVHCLN